MVQVQVREPLKIKHLRRNSQVLFSLEAPTKAPKSSLFRREEVKKSRGDALLSISNARYHFEEDMDYSVPIDYVADFFHEKMLTLIQSLPIESSVPSFLSH